MYESKKAYHYGTGRRKHSVACVRVYENGTGAITINGRDIDDYFGHCSSAAIPASNLSPLTSNLSTRLSSGE